MYKIHILFLFLFLFIQSIHSQNTLNYSLLEKNIDTIIQEGLDSQAYPGAQLLIAKDGEIVLK